MAPARHHGTIPCMALRLASQPVEPPKGPQGLKLSLTTPPTEHPRDIPALLHQEAERWIREWRQVITTHFAASGIAVSDGDLKGAVQSSDLPDADRLQRFLEMGRIPIVTFCPAEDGAFTVSVTSPCNHELSYLCNVDISFPHKSISPTEAALIRQSLQQSFVRQANQTVAESFEPEGAPAFALWADSDVQQITWSDDERAQGFRIVRGQEAQAIYEVLPDDFKEGATAITPSALLLLTANKKASDTYRDTLLAETQRLLHGGVSSRTSFLSWPFKQPPKDDPLTAPLFTLVGNEIVAQAGTDPGGNEYQKRFGINPDAIREALANKKEAALKAAQAAKNDPAGQVRKLFIDYLGESSPYPHLVGLLTRTQGEILAALRKKDRPSAIKAIEEVLPRLPEDVQQQLGQLKTTLEQING